MNRAGPYEPEEPWTILRDLFDAAITESGGHRLPLWGINGDYTRSYGGRGLKYEKNEFSTIATAERK